MSVSQLCSDFSGRLSAPLPSAGLFWTAVAVMVIISVSIAALFAVLTFSGSSFRVWLAQFDLDRSVQPKSKAHENAVSVSILHKAESPLLFRALSSPRSPLQPKSDNGAMGLADDVSSELSLRKRPPSLLLSNTDSLPGIKDNIDSTTIKDIPSPVLGDHEEQFEYAVLVPRSYAGGLVTALLIILYLIYLVYIIVAIVAPSENRLVAVNLLRYGLFGSVGSVPIPTLKSIFGNINANPDCSALILFDYPAQSGNATTYTAIQHLLTYTVSSMPNTAPVGEQSSVSSLVFSLEPLYFTTEFTQSIASITIGNNTGCVYNISVPFLGVSGSTTQVLVYAWHNLENGQGSLPLELRCPLTMIQVERGTKSVRLELLTQQLVVYAEASRVLPMSVRIVFDRVFGDSQDYFSVLVAGARLSRPQGTEIFSQPTSFFIQRPWCNSNEYDVAAADALVGRVNWFPGTPNAVFQISPILRGLRSGIDRGAFDDIKYVAVGYPSMQPTTSVISDVPGFSAGIDMRALSEWSDTQLVSDASSGAKNTRSIFTELLGIASLAGSLLALQPRLKSLATAFLLALDLGSRSATFFLWTIVLFQPLFSTLLIFSLGYPAFSRFSFGRTDLTLYQVIDMSFQGILVFFFTLCFDGLGGVFLFLLCARLILQMTERSRFIVAFLVAATVIGTTLFGIIAFIALPMYRKDMILFGLTPQPFILVWAEREVLQIIGFFAAALLAVAVLVWQSLFAATTLAQDTIVV